MKKQKKSDGLHTLWWIFWYTEPLSYKNISKIGNEKYDFLLSDILIVQILKRSSFRFRWEKEDGKGCFLPYLCNHDLQELENNSLSLCARTFITNPFIQKAGDVDDAIWPFILVLVMMLVIGFISSFHSHFLQMTISKTVFHPHPETTVCNAPDIS